MAVTYYVQSGATSDNCGGTDADDSLARSGTDGVSNSTTTFTSATAAFVAGDVGRGIWINTTTPRWRIIASVTNGTTVVLNTALTTTQSGLSWKIGGSWKTLAQLYSANGFASGDSAWAIGTFREVVTVNMTSATATTSLFGDPANSKGFKNSSGVAISPGPVIWTAYTTNDTTTPSTSSLCNWNGRDYLDFQFLIFVGGNTQDSVFSATTTISVNCSVSDCVFYGGRATNACVGINITGLADTALNLTVTRCVFFSLSRALNITLPTSGVADYDCNIQVTNCLHIAGNSAIVVNSSGALAFKAGGVDVLNNTGIGGSGAILITLGTSLSTATPCTIYNSVICNAIAVGISAGAAGQILEDYNYIFAATPRTNVTAGTHSIVVPTYAPLLEVDQAYFQGRLPINFFMPSNGSPFLNFGNQAGGPTVDILNRQRPAGAAGASYAIGAYERHNTGIAGGTANADAGNCLQLGPGPADHDFLIPVNAVATVISIKQKTASYGGTNYPQIVLLANGELGVATQTVADSSAHTSYTTLTLASFTPSKAGWVTLRLQNLTNDGVGIVYWDTAVLPSVNLTGFDNYNRTEPFPAIDAAAGGIMTPQEG